MQYQRLTFSTRRSLEPRVSIRDIRNEGKDFSKRLADKLTIRSADPEADGMSWGRMHNSSLGHLS